MYDKNNLGPRFYFQNTLKQNSTAAIQLKHNMYFVNVNNY